MTTSYQKISGFDLPKGTRNVIGFKNFHSGERVKKFPDLLANSPYACAWTIAVSGKKNLRIQKYPDRCRRGLRCPKMRNARANRAKLLFFIIRYAKFMTLLP